MANVLEMFKKRIKEVDDSVKSLESGKEINFAVKNEFMDYGSGRASYMRANVDSNLFRLKENSWELVELGVNPNNRQIILQILGKAESFKKGAQPPEIRKIISELTSLTNKLSYIKTVEDDISFIQIPKLPEVIAEEIAADLNELRKCFVSGAYRGCVVLCGRVMETALHRKYFEVAGQDLLETAPNIGLGNLIAKLKEQNVKIDPGLTQQIHLINQVRVFSVHSKKEAFYPSKEQAHATILYTVDILNKLFSKG